MYKNMQNSGHSVQAKHFYYVVDDI